MRVSFDANFLISALLPTRNVHRPIHTIFQAALDERFALLVPDEVLREVEEKIVAKPYLASRIPMSMFWEVAILLTRIRVSLPTLSGPFPRIVRDPDDDYLLAYAEFGRADFLISGDHDLRQVDDTVLPFDIVSPAAFLAKLRDRGLLTDA